jgi:hypothetical protein
MKTKLILSAGVLLALLFAGCDPSHEVVCKCRCGMEDVTFTPEAGKDCESYNEKDCETKEGGDNKLDNCTAKVVPKGDKKDEGK